MLKLLPLLVVLLSGLGVVSEAASADIQEWPVPWEESRPRDPYVDSEGRVWFVGQRGNYLAMLDPGSGEFKQFPLDPGTGPHNLIVSDSGTVWYAGNRAAHIGRLDPANGEIDKIPMPDPKARDPHTLVFDHSGNIWFTVQGGNFIGRLVVSTERIDLIPVPESGSRPYGIVIDSSGRPWVAEFGTNKLATVDPSSLKLTEYELPWPDARPRRLGVTSDDHIWYVDYARGKLGQFDPKMEEFSEYSTPGGYQSRPYGMAVDALDRVWFVESGPHPNRLVGFDTGRKAVFSIADIESGGGTVRHMYFDRSRNQIWFGTDTNTIGRVRLD